MSKRMRRSLLFVALALGCVCPVRAAPDIREGLWEISVQAEVNGQPVTAAPMIVRQCVNNQSVQELMAQVGGAGACNITDFQHSGSRARWNISCSGPINVTGKGETELAGDDRFSGRMDLQIGMGGETMPMAQSFQAQRVGNCQ
jgi:Protein of unknown function (DUF3617)